MAIAIYVNGKREDIGKSLTIQGLLDVKKIKPEVVTVELNEEIVAKDKYKDTVLRSEDKLEFVYYMGGGGSTQSRLRQFRSPY